MKARRTGSAPSTPRLLVAALLGVLCLPGLAAAAPDWLAAAPDWRAAAPDWRKGAQEALEPNNLVRPSGISVERCANIVRRETGGRVLSATPSERGGQPGCDVRVLVDGKRVMSVFVDGNGRMRGG
ncbi:MAG: hypothetical protein RIC56_11900 [Pseudomonadales bacterium]